MASICMLPGDGLACWGPEKKQLSPAQQGAEQGGRSGAQILTAHLHDYVQDFTFLRTEVKKHLNNNEGSFLAPRCCSPPLLLLCALKASPDLEMSDAQVGRTIEGTGW